jgi:hypothetical protein
MSQRSDSTGRPRERLRLVAADAALLQADLDGAEALAVALDAEVPSDWPPETWGEGAVGRGLATEAVRG